MEKLTQKQETFCLNIFKGLSQREAYIQAGYSTNNSTVVQDQNACVLLKNNKVAIRLAELNKKTEDAAIADKKECMQICTEIARASLTNFVEVGQDGAWFNIDKTNLNSRAIQSVQSKTVVGKDGADDAVFIRVNLHDPLKAIDLLSKLRGDYSDGTNVNVDNRTINVIVESKEQKLITDALTSGE